MNAFTPEFDGVDELLSAYLDGELSPADRAKVDALLAEREDYRAALAELRSLRTNILTLPAVKASSGFYARVLAAISQATIEDAPLSELKLGEAKSDASHAAAATIAAAPAAAAPAPAPRAESNIPVWGILAACALAASFALALLGPSWWNRTSEVAIKPEQAEPQTAAKAVRATAKPQNIVKPQNAAPPEIEAKKVSHNEERRKTVDEAAAPSAPPIQAGGYNPAPNAKPLIAAKPSANPTADAVPNGGIGRGGSQTNGATAGPSPPGFAKPAAGNANDRALEPKPGEFGRRKVADAESLEKVLRDTKGTQEVVIAQLQLSKEGPSREALRDFFAWQGVQWRGNLTKDALAQARAGEETTKSLPATAAPNDGAGKFEQAGNSEQGRGEGLGGRSLIETKRMDLQRAKDKADGIDESVDAIYLEISPERWREMRAVLADWQGTKLNVVNADQATLYFREDREVADGRFRAEGGGAGLGAGGPAAEGVTVRPGAAGPGAAPPAPRGLPNAKEDLVDRKVAEAEEKKLEFAKGGAAPGGPMPSTAPMAPPTRPVAPNRGLASDPAAAAPPAKPKAAVPQIAEAKADVPQANAPQATRGMNDALHLEAQTRERSAGFENGAAKEAEKYKSFAFAVPQDLSKSVVDAVDSKVKQLKMDAFGAQPDNKNPAEGRANADANGNRRAKGEAKAEEKQADAQGVALRGAVGAVPAKALNEHRVRVVIVLKSEDQASLRVPAQEAEKARDVAPAALPASPKK